jgi:hypothetical protein
MDGHLKIIKYYNYFNENIFPMAALKIGLESNDLTFNDYCLNC